MGRNSQPCKFEIVISIDGADYVPFDSLTPEQHNYAMRKMSERLSRNMSEYYSNHMDEYEKIAW